VITANRLRDARVRITVAPPGPTEMPPRALLLVMGQETAGYPLELYERGMTVCIVDQFRQSPWDPLAGHKTTSYYPRLVALRGAQGKGCGEALWATPEGRLAEGCMSNLFVVKGGKLKTPAVDTPVLPGVTRAVVLELAAAAGIPAEEGPCSIDDLLEADEVFLTNAIMEVMPVTRVERRGIGAEKPGSVTLALGEAYRKVVGEG
jgi:branched-subunit amino acid aminotransferase/4-amino-4-deoxychorismate lyase